jgi:hypothetical protein
MSGLRLGHAGCGRHRHSRRVEHRPCPFPGFLVLLVPGAGPDLGTGEERPRRPRGSMRTVPAEGPISADLRKWQVPCLICAGEADEMQTTRREPLVRSPARSSSHSPATLTYPLSMKRTPCCCTTFSICSTQLLQRDGRPTVRVAGRIEPPAFRHGCSIEAIRSGRQHVLARASDLREKISMPQVEVVTRQHLGRRPTCTPRPGGVRALSRGLIAV